MDANAAKLIGESFNSASRHRWTAWIAVGPLVGVSLGGYLTSRSQRRKWLADNKKDEYRELIAQLVKSFDEIRLFVEDSTVPGFDTAYELAIVLNRPLMVIRDRIFISKEITELEVSKRWGRAVDGFRGDRDVRKFASAFEDIRKSMVEKAASLRV
jgi:hypothetical protein